MSKLPESDAGYVLVYPAAGMVEANLVRSVLEAAGIPVLVFAESAGAAYGITVGELARADLWVPRDRQAEAEELLARLRTPDADELDEGDIPPDQA